MSIILIYLCTMIQNDVLHFYIFFLFYIFFIFLCRNCTWLEDFFIFKYKTAPQIVEMSEKRIAKLYRWNYLQNDTSFCLFKTSFLSYRFSRPSVSSLSIQKWRISRFQTKWTLSGKFLTTTVSQSQNVSTFYMYDATWLLTKISYCLGKLIEKMKAHMC